MNSIPKDSDSFKQGRTFNGWHVAPYYCTVTGNLSGWFIRDEDEITVATVHIGPLLPLPTAEQVAHHIAASVDTKDALETVQTLVGDTLERTWPALSVLVKEALAKARGEA